MDLQKIFKIVALLLGLAGVVFWFLLISKGDDYVKMTGEGVSPMLYTGYIIMAIVVLMVLMFVVSGVLAGNVKKTLMSVGAFLAVVVISYVMASGSTEGLPLVDNEMVSESTSRWVGTGLIAFYILAVAAIGSMVFSGVKKVQTK
jgi:accessory gene regulator protein AgrB